MAIKNTKKPTKSEKRQADGKFKPGVSGNPAGAPKGYKKLKTKLVEAKLEELGYDPIMAMVELAKDKRTPIPVKAKLASELAGFVYPKRKAVEYSGSDGGPIQHEVGMRPPLTREEWEKKHGLDTATRTTASGD